MIGRIFSNDKEVNLLRLAAEKSDIKSIQELIKSKNIDVNWQDQEGFTALHAASYKDHVKAVKALLEAQDIKVNGIANF